MAVSGSKNYSITRADIVGAALRKIGVYDAGETISGPDNAAAATALNLMVKEWVARGIDIWLRDEVTLFLQPNTQSYALGSAYMTASYVETTLSSAASASATALSLTSSSGMTVADNIGIKLDDDTIHWDTIATIPSSTSVTLTTGLASAASSGKKVYAYTTTAGRPMKIVSAYRRDKNGYDTRVEVIGEAEYRSLSNKASEGPPVAIWYQPTLTTGTLYVWPVDGGANWDRISMSAQYYPDDFDAQADNPQFPIEWGNALVWSLAAELSSEHGLPEREQAKLWQVAEFKLNELLAYDVENADVEFGMDYMR
jgi:hypothetical protein